MVKIIIDSTTDIGKEYKSQFLTVPMTIRFGDTEYTDGVTITKDRFYEMLIESDTLPTTSQATPDAFEKVFSEVVANGDSAVVITVSSKLSGTYQSALIAAADYEGKIFVVDSRSVAIGTGILAIRALEIAKTVNNAKAVADRVSALCDDIRVIAMLDTLEYLKKGGRISPTIAFAGGLLSIKPVCAIEDGEIKLLGRARGSKQANNLLVSEIEKAGGVDFKNPVLVGYTGLDDTLMKKYIEDSKSLWQNSKTALSCVQIGSVVGTHAGPGAVAVAFFKNN